MACIGFDGAKRLATIVSGVYVEEVKRCGILTERNTPGRALQANLPLQTQADYKKVDVKAMEMSSGSKLTSADVGSKHLVSQRLAPSRAPPTAAGAVNEVSQILALV